MITAPSIQEVHPDLPGWCRRLSYSADDDTITIHAGTNSGAVLAYEPQSVDLEMTPEECEALLAALQRVLSHRSRPVLDVPVAHPSDASR